jgi:hypothetical protein
MENVSHHHATKEKQMSDQRLVVPTEGSHFYKPDASALYDVPNKSKPGQYRKATIKDAKSAGAWPSVTTVLNVLEKPALTAWKISNAVTAALTLPRIDGEDADAFAARVVVDADSVSKDSMDLGTTVHNAIERYLSGEQIPAEVMVKYVQPVDNWLTSQGIKIEQLEVTKVSDLHKFGCRVDAIGTDRNFRRVIIDWKTQKSPNGKLNAWEDHAYQLAANCKAAFDTLDDIRVINVYVSTTSLDDHGQALMMVKEWTPAEVTEGWEMFHLCRRIYQIKNGI